MNLTLKNPAYNESTLIWAIVCSVLLHAILAIVVPKFNYQDFKKPVQELTIEIKKPPPPPPPVAEPEPPQPVEPVKPEPIKPKIEPKPKPIAKPIERPSPIEEPSAEPPPPAPSVPEVIAVAPKADTKPAVVAPAPVESPRPPEPSPVDVDNALGEYGNLLGRAIAKHKRYPEIARRRNLQGEVLLDLKLDGNGKVLSANVRESSGHEILDNQALEMVRKASPFPAPPEALRNRTFNITVPVSFKLEES